MTTACWYVYMCFTCSTCETNNIKELLTKLSTLCELELSYTEGLFYIGNGRSNTSMLYHFPCGRAISYGHCRKLISSYINYIIYQIKDSLALWRSASLNPECRWIFLFGKLCYFRKEKAIWHLPDCPFHSMVGISTPEKGCHPLVLCQTNNRHMISQVLYDITLLVKNYHGMLRIEESE